MTSVLLTRLGNRSRSLVWPIGIVAISFLVIGIAYRDLPKTFFQQDEWAAFSRLYFLENQGDAFSALLTQPTPRVVTGVVILNYAQWLLFKLDPVPWTYVSIALHGVASVLVGVVAGRLVDRTTGALAAVLFAAGASYAQGVTWITASSAALPPLILSLGAILIYIGPRVRPPGFKRLIASALLLALGLAFRETVLAVVMLLGVLTLFWRTEESRRWIRVLPLAIVGLIYVTYAGSLFFNRPLGLVNEALPPTIRPAAALHAVLTTPFRGVVQSVVPQEAIYVLAEASLGAVYPEFDEIRNTADGARLILGPGANVITIIISIIIVVIVVGAFFLYRRSKRGANARGIAFGFLFAFAGSATFVALAASTGRVVPLESRYLYAPGAGMALVIAALLSVFVRRAAALPGRFLMPKNMVSVAFPSAPRSIVFALRLRTFGLWMAGVVALAVIGSTLFINVRGVRSSIRVGIDIGDQRREILERIVELKPALSDRVIFFVESDTPYYGRPQARLPFQGGFGHILQVLYSDRGELSPSLMEGLPFWQELSQGYVEKDGFAFGYFLQREPLYHLLNDERHGLTEDDVVALRWRGKTGQLTDFTTAFRKRATVERRLAGPAPGGGPTAVMVASDVGFEWLQVLSSTNSDTAEYSRLGVYRTGLDSSYGGVFTQYEIKAGSSAVTIPPILSGYGIHNIWSVSTGEPEVPLTGVEKRRDGTFELDISRKSAEESLMVQVGLSVPFVEFNSLTGKIERVVVPDTLQLVAVGDRLKYIVPVDGKLRSLRSTFTTAGGYVPIALIDGRSEQLVFWSGYDSSNLEVEFRRPPQAGSIVEFPVLVELEGVREQEFMDALGLDGTLLAK